MTIPFHLEVNGFELPDSIKNIIEKQLSVLLDRYPRIINCNLLVRAPNGHHHKGEPFQVTLTFSLPGGLQVEASPAIGQLDPRQADVRFAIDDAFRRARRRLDEEESKREARQKQRRTNRPKATPTKS